jgi:hypothetical protein
MICVTVVTRIEGQRRYIYDVALIKDFAFNSLLYLSTMFFLGRNVVYVPSCF